MLSGRQLLFRPSLVHLDFDFTFFLQHPNDTVPDRKRFRSVTVFSYESAFFLWKQRVRGSVLILELLRFLVFEKEPLVVSSDESSIGCATRWV